MSVGWETVSRLLRPASTTISSAGEIKCRGLDQQMTRGPGSRWMGKVEARGGGECELALSPTS